MTTTIPGQILLETLRCSICNNFLSVPPITIISVDGKKQKCRRCTAIKTDVDTRNVFFENIAVITRFPCSYPGCKRILDWEEVQSHEDICSYRTLKCPIFSRCEEIIKISDLESHFENNHQTNLQYESFSDECIEFGTYRISLLMLSGEPYLVVRYITKTIFWYRVFSLLLDGNCEYDLKIWSKESTELSLLFSSETVLFKESDHCLKCAMGKCLDMSHKNSTPCNGSQQHSDTFIMNIDPDFVRSSLKSNEFQSTITFRNHTNLLADTPIPFQKLISNNKLMERVLQCPVCEEYMTPPIFICGTGHTICNVCKTRIVKCPTCKLPLGNSRNFSLEELAGNVVFPCQYGTNGCNCIGNIGTISRHRLECGNGSTNSEEKSD